MNLIAYLYYQLYNIYMQTISKQNLTLEKLAEKVNELIISLEKTTPKTEIVKKVAKNKAKK